MLPRVSASYIATSKAVSTFRCLPSNPQAGALELESAELRFETSADGRDATVARKQELPMMRTVAEAMIAANAAVAERIAGAFPAGALLRRHPPPRLEAFAEVVLLNITNFSI